MSAWTKTKEFLKPVFRSLVCLVLCAALLLGAFPTKADALALETGLAIGAIACLILMTAGVVFNPQTVEDIQAIGHDFQTFMYEWGTSAEKLDEVEDWFSGLSIINPEGDDGDDRYGRTTINLARGLLVGISLWVASIALNKRQVEDPTASSRYGFTVANAWYGNGAGFKHLYADHDSWFKCFKQINEYRSAIIYGYTSDYLTGWFWDDTGLFCQGIWENPFPNSTSSVLGVYDLNELVLLGSAFAGSLRLYFDKESAEASQLYGSDRLSAMNWNLTAYSSGYKVYYCNHSGNWTGDVTWILTESGNLTSAFDSPQFLCPGSASNVTWGEYFPAISPPAIFGDVQSDLESGAISEEEVPLYNLNYADVLPQGKPVLESIQDLSAMFVSEELTVEEYLEMGHATVSGASEPVFTEDLDFEWFPSYYVGETPPVYSVDAISPDGGTIFYQWHLSGGDNSDFIITEYSSEESAKSFIVPLDTPGIYHLWCMAENRVYSDTLGEYEYFVAWKASSVASLRVLESDVNVDPDPGVDSDPDVNQDLADKVGSAVGDAFNQAGQSEKTEASNTGSDLVGQLIDVIPNYSEGFVTALGAFASNFSYEGTDAILTVPQIRFPEIPGKTKGPPLVKSFVMMDEKQVDFSEFAEMIPEQLLLLVQCLLTAALIVFCGKELYDTISYVLTLRKGE